MGTGTCSGYEGAHLVLVDEINAWTSPRLGIRFQVEADAIVLLRPDGRPFESFLDVERRAEDEARGRHEERTAREEAEPQARRLAEKLRELGVDPDQL